MNNPKILGTKGAKRRTPAEQAAQIQSEILSMLSYANAQVPVERRVTPKTVLSVARRELNSSRGLSFSARRDGVLLEVSDFIRSAHGDLALAAESRHRDLLPVSHPLSTSKHLFAMTASAVKSSRTAWLLADSRISEDARPLIASAFAADENSAQYVYSIAGLRASGNYEVYEALVAAFGAGDGNSYWARSMRAKLQRRDRYGRFAYMGGGLRALIRSGGSVSWLTGRVVGMDNKSETYDMETPDGKIYRIPAGDAEGLKAVITKKGSNGFSAPIQVSASDEKNIIDISDLAEVSSPAGWDTWGEAQTMEDGTKFQSFRHESGEYSVGQFIKPDGSREYAIKDEKNADAGQVLARVGSWADVATALRTNTSNKEKREVKARLADEGLQALEGEDLAGLLDDGDPAKDIRLDVAAGDVEGQIQAAIDGGDNLEFNYNGKNRRLTPIRIEDGRNGARNLLAIGKDGQYKKFNVDSLADFNDSDPMSEESLDVAAAPKAQIPVAEEAPEVTEAPKSLASLKPKSSKEAEDLRPGDIVDFSEMRDDSYPKGKFEVVRVEGEPTYTSGEQDVGIPNGWGDMEFIFRPVDAEAEQSAKDLGWMDDSIDTMRISWDGDANDGNYPEFDFFGKRDELVADGLIDPEFKPFVGVREEAAAETPAAGAIDLNSIIAKTLKFKGLTIRPNGEMPEDGIVVAVRGTNKEIPADDFFSGAADEQIADWISEYADQLDAGGEFFIGTWFDEENNEVVLDVAERFTDRDEAIQAGRDRNQQKIYDIGTGELIDTGGTGDRAAEQQEARSGDDTTTEGQEVVGDEPRGDSGVRPTDSGSRQAEAVIPARAADDLIDALDQMIFNADEADVTALENIASLVRDGVLPSGYTYEDLALMAEGLAFKADEGDSLELIGYEDDLRDIADYIRGLETGRDVDQQDFESELGKPVPSFEAPEGMYQLDLQGFNPSEDEDPARLANTFDDKTIQDSLFKALAGNGSTLMDFNDGEGEVPVSAEALYYALEEAGFDAEDYVRDTYSVNADGVVPAEESKDGDIVDFIDKKKFAKVAKGVADEKNKPVVADEDADFEEKPSTGNLPPLLEGLTDEERQQLIDSNFDHVPFLPANKYVEMPDGYNQIALEPFTADEVTTVEEGDALNQDGFPVGWTDDPYWIANNYSDNEEELIRAFKDSFSPDNQEPGFVLARYMDENGEPFDAWVNARAVRDALQLQGVDTNEIIKSVADEGFAGQRGENSDLTDGDMEAMIDGEGIDINEKIEGDAPEEVLPARSAVTAEDRARYLELQEIIRAGERDGWNIPEELSTEFNDLVDKRNAGTLTPEEQSRLAELEVIIRAGERDGWDMPTELSKEFNELGEKIRQDSIARRADAARIDSIIQRAFDKRDASDSQFVDYGPVFAEIVDAIQNGEMSFDIPRNMDDIRNMMDIIRKSNPRLEDIAASDFEDGIVSEMYDRNLIDGDLAYEAVEFDINAKPSEFDEAIVENIVKDAFDGKTIPTKVDEVIDSAATKKGKKKKKDVPAPADVVTIEEAKKNKKKSEKVKKTEVEDGSPEAEEAFNDVILTTEGDEVDTPEFFEPDQPIDGRTSLAGGTVVESVTVTPAGGGSPLIVTGRLLPRYDGEPERYAVTIADSANPKENLESLEVSTLQEVQELHKLTMEGLRNGSIVINEDPNYGVEADDISEGDRSPYVKNRALRGTPFERFRILGNKAFQKWREENYIYADGRNQARMGDRVVHFYDGFNGKGEGRIIGWETVHNAGDRARKGYAYVQFQDGTYALWATDMMFLNGRAPNSVGNKDYDPPSGAAAPRPYLDPNRVQQVALTNRYIVEKRREGTVIQPYTSIDKRTWKAETRRAYDMYLRRKARIDAYRQAQGLPTQPAPRLRPRGDRKHFPVWVRAILTRDDGGDNAGGIDSLRSGQRGGNIQARARRIVEAAGGDPNNNTIRREAPAAAAAPQVANTPTEPIMTTGQLAQLASRLDSGLSDDMRKTRMFSGYDAYANEASIGNELTRYTLSQNTITGKFTLFFQTALGGRRALTTYDTKESAYEDLMLRINGMGRSFGSTGSHPMFVGSDDMTRITAEFRSKLARHGAVVKLVNAGVPLNIIDVSIPDTPFRYRVVQDNLTGDWSSFVANENGVPTAPVGRGTRLRYSEVMDGLDGVIKNTLDALAANAPVPDDSPDGFLADRWLDRSLEEIVPPKDVDFTGLSEGVKENDPNRVDPNPALDVNGQPLSKWQLIKRGWTPRKAAEIAHAAISRPSFKHIQSLYSDYFAARQGGDYDTIQAAHQEIVDAFKVGMGHGTTISGITVLVKDVAISSYSDDTFNVRVVLDLRDKDGRPVHGDYNPYRTFEFRHGKIVDIENNYLRIKNGVSGASGFSSAYNNFSENWYIANGAPHITVHAMGGTGWTGALVWALTGFHWQSGASARKMMKAVRTKVNGTPQNSRARKDFDAYIKKSAAALGVPADFDSVYDALGNIGTSLPAGLPTPKRLALVGWTPKEAVRGDKGNWAGKSGMLTTDWYGRKNLQPNADERVEQIAYDDMKFFRKLHNSGKTDFKPNSWLKKAFSDKMSDYTGDMEGLAKYSDELSEFLKGRGKKNADGEFTGTYSVSMLSAGAKAALNKWATESLLSGSYRSGGTTAAAKRKDEENAAVLADLVGALHRDTTARYPSRNTMPARGQQLVEMNPSVIQGIGDTEQPILVDGVDTGLVGKRLTGDESGISATWKIVDTESGETFYVKDLTDNDVLGADSVNAEVKANVVARAMNLIGVAHVMPMKDNPNMIVTSEVAATVAVPKLPTSITDAQNNRMVRLSDHNSAGEVDSMDIENAIGMGLFDLIVANDDRHEANVMMVRGRSTDESSTGAGTWIPVPFDHAFSELFNESGRVDRMGDDIEIDTLLDSFQYSAPGGWMRDYIGKMGPVAFKMIVDRRLDTLMHNLRASYGGYLSEEEADAVMGRAQKLRDMSASDWEAKLV